MRHENVVRVLAFIRDQHPPVVVLPMYPNVRQYLIRKPDANKLHLVCPVALTSFQKLTIYSSPAWLRDLRTSIIRAWYIGVSELYVFNYLH